MPSWSAEEDEALQGLPLLDQVVYLRGLRSRMSYATGIVGAYAHLSWVALAEAAAVAAGPPGSHHNEDTKPSRKQIRSALDRLESAGLIEKLPDSKRFSGLVFFLPLAVTDRSVSNRRGQGGAMEEGPYENSYGSKGNGSMRGHAKMPANAEEGPASESELLDPPLSPPQGGRERAMQANGAKNRRNRGSREQQARDCVLDKLKKANGRKDD